MADEENKKKINIKKIGIGATIVAFTGIAVLAGSDQLKANNSFKRVINADGTTDLDGLASYDVVRGYKVVEVDTIVGENKLFLAEQSMNPFTPETYYDVFSGKRVCATNLSTEAVSYSEFEDCLIACGLLQDRYTPEDVEYVFDFAEENYEDMKKKMLKLPAQE